MILRAKIIILIILIFIKQEIKLFIDLILKHKPKYKDLKSNKNDYKIFSKFSYKKKTKDKILVTSFLGINDYLKYEYLLAVYLSEIEKKNIIILLEENDSISKNFFLTKGLNNFIYFKSKPNFYKRITYQLKSFLLISKFKNIEDFVKFKLDGIPTGKVIYSHVSRFSRVPTFNNINAKFFNAFAIYLHFREEFKNILSKNNIKYFIQSEPQFIPPAIFMGYALKKKIRMISRIGNNKIISVRNIDSVNNFNESRWKYDKNFFYIIKKRYKTKAIKIGNKILEDRLKGRNQPDKDIDIEGIKLAKIKNIKFVENYNKKIICKYFKWDASKPIGAIFANDLTDGLFTNKWGIYRDNYTWLKEVLNYASKNDKVNWIVKSHPSDLKNDSKHKTKHLFERNIYPDNIKFLPENWGRKKLHKVVNIIFTNYGSAGYEYPALGIPAVISSESHYYGLNIAYETHTTKELKKIIMISHKIKKLKKKVSNNAKIFIFLENNFTKTRIDLATLDHVYEDTNSDNYWEDYIRNFRKTDIYKSGFLHKDEFYKTFRHQIKKKLKHCINKNYI